MPKRILITLVLTVLLSLLLALPSLAKMSEREVLLRSRTTLIDQFGIPQQYELVRDDDRESIDSRRDQTFQRWRAPLGSAVSTPGPGVGELIDNTYNDIQRYTNQGRIVEHSYDTANGYVDVHFVYEEFMDPEDHNVDTLFASPNKSGYNVWNANDSTWPWGQEAGCLLQSGDSAISGATSNLVEPYTMLDIMPNGLVVFGASDNYLAKAQAQGWYTEDDGFFVDNHIYYQESRHSCFYDTGGTGSNSTFVPAAGGSDYGYQAGMMAGDTATGGVISIATQQVGSDTITHVLIREWPDQLWLPINEDTWHAFKYFRKLGGTYTGTWEEGQIMDTVWRRSSPALAASRVSAKVAVAYTLINATGIVQDNERDSDLMYRESTNGGVDWSAPVDVTQYRRDTISATGGYAVQALYDMQDRLHIIWRPTETSMNPYRDNYFWGDFSANVMHWCDANPTILSKVAHGNYGIAANTAQCGMGSPGTGYVASINVSECDGNLYCVWMQLHRRQWLAGLPFAAWDDCSNQSERTIRGNWDMWVSVSSTLDGLLWDAPRGLSNTYTPNCDSALGDVGACQNEYKPAVEKYGLNEDGLGLKWPEKALIDPDTVAFGPDSAYDGNYFLNMSYLDDEFPGSWYYTGARRNDIPRLNALKWLRVACVDPIPAPQIMADPTSVSWTDELAWVRNGEADTITVTVSNDGNEPLDVFTIGTYEETGSNWLSTSDASLAVPAGVPNTGTFDVIVDASALTYGLGNASWLDGEVYLKSDAGNNDSLSIMVHFLAADEVPAVNWDTAATSTAWDPAKGGASAAGDNFALSISNFGEFGLNGLSAQGDTVVQANFDFFRDGGECREDDRGRLYAWGGSPFIIQHDGGGSNLRLTTSFIAEDQAPDNSFDPLIATPGLSGGVSTGGEYDSVYTGPFADRDTAVILERTFYAPRNNPSNPSFMVCKTVAYSGDGQQQDNVTIGSYTDWDIPSVGTADVEPSNIVGTSAPSSPAGQFVYAQGTDADTSGNIICQVNANRYGAELFLDWHTNTEFNTCAGCAELRVCAANDTTWGSWGTRQGIAADTLIGDIIEPNAQRWYDSISVKQGLFADDTAWDQSIWVTYLFDYSLGATDTLTFYTLFATLHDGSLNDLENNLVDARAWYMLNIRGAECPGCCIGIMGNVDCDGAQTVDIGDVTELIQLLFIRVGDPYCCEDEADLDYNDVIDIGDLSILIKRLFITVTDPPPCP